jgi:flagellum-specific ATP synthase
MNQTNRIPILQSDDYLGLKSIPRRLQASPRRIVYGKVAHLVGSLIEVDGLAAALGDVCRITPSAGSEPIFAEVVGFNRTRLKLSPLTPLAGICPGDLVCISSQTASIEVGRHLLGRVINGMGRPIDDLGPLPPGIPYPLAGKILSPLKRPLIQEQLDLGIRCINSLLPVGKGQRIGIFAGSGVGKSTLLGMIAQYTSAPVNVIALIGERGREVNEFLEKELGPEGVKRSVVVVATSDEPATIRMRATFAACSIAEYFRDQGLDVLLMMDSVTRFAMASREIGLAAGEPPTTKGYTPSVFAQLPLLVERAGNFQNASITAIYTVLVEGDDMEEPIADTLRSLLDGHIVLDRALAQRRHFPAINVLKSVSRLTGRLLKDENKPNAAKFIQTLANYKNSEDMIRIGAYVPGSHAETDFAIKMIDKLNAFLCQAVGEACTIKSAYQALAKLFA